MMAVNWGPPGSAAGSVTYGYDTLGRRLFATRTNVLGQEVTRSDWSHEIDNDLN